MNSVKEKKVKTINSINAVIEKLRENQSVFRKRNISRGTFFYILLFSSINGVAEAKKEFNWMTFLRARKAMNDLEIEPGHLNKQRDFDFKKIKEVMEKLKENQSILKKRKIALGTFLYIWLFLSIHGLNEAKKHFKPTALYYARKIMEELEIEYAV